MHVAVAGAVALQGVCVVVMRATGLNDVETSLDGQIKELAIGRVAALKEQNGFRPNCVIDRPGRASSRHRPRKIGLNLSSDLGPAHVDAPRVSLPYKRGADVLADLGPFEFERH